MSNPHSKTDYFKGFTIFREVTEDNIDSVIKELKKEMIGGWYRLVRKQKELIWNIPVGFDTETSSIFYDEHPEFDPHDGTQGCMVTYLWQMGFGDPERAYGKMAVFGRTLSILRKFLNAVSKAFGLMESIERGKSDLTMTIGECIEQSHNPDWIHERWDNRIDLISRMNDSIKEWNRKQYQMHTGKRKKTFDVFDDYGDPYICRMVVFVHNLGFDWQSLQGKDAVINSGTDDSDSMVEQFNNSAYHPIYVKTALGFEWRDSLILSGGKLLQSIAEDLDNGSRKLVGDLDYDKIRTPITPLTDEELGYAKADVDVLCSYIAREIEQHRKNITYIPLTNTGRVRTYCKQEIHSKKKKTFDKDGKVKRVNSAEQIRYKELMKKCTLDPDDYIFCKQGFIGGFAHKSINIGDDEIIENVNSRDIASSYPDVTVVGGSGLYPMGEAEHYDRLTYEEYTEIANDFDRCILATFHIPELALKKGMPDAFFSLSKTLGAGNWIDVNGRITYCTDFEAIMVDADFKTFSRVYDFDIEDIKIVRALVWKSDYLPTPLLRCILKFYKDKTELKGVEGKEVDYQIGKGMLNSTYGMSVMRILRPETFMDANGDWQSWNFEDIFDDDSDEEKQKKQAKIDDCVKKNNEAKTKFLYYPWGLWITAYARERLWNGILECGDDYIYSDTDCIKYRANSEGMKRFLKNDAEDQEKRIQDFLYHRTAFCREDLEPISKKGKKKLLGAWEFDGHYTYFKSLGAKRYVTYSKEDYEKDLSKAMKELNECTDEAKRIAIQRRIDILNIEKGLKVTVSGAKKHMVSKKLWELGKGDPIEAIKAFKSGLVLDEDESGDLSHIPMKDCDVWVKDYLGNDYHIQQANGIALKKSTFQMTKQGDPLDVFQRIELMMAKHKRGEI